jgi:hypothetical protein
MAKLLFPQFLSDVGQYEQAEAYWREMWAAVVSLAGRAHEWRSPWLDNRFGDGSPCRDGNPIFSAVNDREKRGVQILQYQHTAPDEVDLDWWLDFFGEKTEPTSIQKLVVSCVLSDCTAGKVQDLLVDWVTRGQVPVAYEPVAPPP